MKNLFLALRAVTAVIMTAQRFELQISVFPKSLFECLMKALDNAAGNHSNLFFCIQDGQTEWNNVSGAEKIAVSIESNAKTIIVKIVDSGIQHTSVWSYKRFAELDTNIINTIIKYVSYHTVDITKKVKVAQQLYLTEQLEEQSGVIFGNARWSADNSTLVTVEISVDGVKIEIEDNEKITKNCTIQWDQILRWLYRG